MDSGGNAPGARPVNYVFCSGEAQPLQLDGTDRRFWIVDAAKAVPLGHPPAKTAQAAAVTELLNQQVSAWLSRPLAIAGNDLLTRAVQHTSRSGLWA